MLEVLYVINIFLTALAFGFWKESFYAGLFMAASIFGVSMFVKSIVGG